MPIAPTRSRIGTESTALLWCAVLGEALALCVLAALGAMAASLAAGAWFVFWLVASATALLVARQRLSDRAEDLQVAAASHRRQLEHEARLQQVWHALQQCAREDTAFRTALPTTAAEAERAARAIRARSGDRLRAAHRLVRSSIRSHMVLDLRPWLGSAGTPIQPYVASEDRLCDDARLAAQPAGAGSRQRLAAGVARSELEERVQLRPEGDGLHPEYEPEVRRCLV